MQFHILRLIPVPEFPVCCVCQTSGVVRSGRRDAGGGRQEAGHGTWEAGGGRREVGGRRWDLRGGQLETGDGRCRRLGDRR